MSSSSVDNGNRSILIEEAELAAKQVAFQWIKKTLHETLLQGLKGVWTLRVVDGNTPSNSSDKEDTTIVEVSREGLEECLSFVEKVKDIWIEKLIGADHERVADWVQEVFESGQKTLWRQSNDSDTGSTGGETTSPEIKNAVGEKSSSGNVSMIPFCKLRRMTRKTFVGQQVAESPLEEFKKMGSLGESYWPLDWDIIEKACERLPKRQISSDRDDGQKRKRDDDEGSKNPDDPLNKRPKRQRGRLPSNVSSIRGSTDGFSSFEKEDLDRLIHDKNHQSQQPALVLFGGLQKVGQVHCSKRFQSDWSEKKKKRELHAATSQRIFPNKVAGASDSIRSYRSKILKTQNQNDESHYSFDFDLGFSLMEMPGDEDNDKRLCAFSSIEITLQDQDDDHNVEKEGTVISSGEEVTDVVI